MAIYLFTSGTTWTIPAGVTSIQVECFSTRNGFGGVGGGNPGFNGASYSKTTSIAVTPGNTLRISIAADQGNTDVWATTVATGTPVVGSTYTTSNSCLAKGPGIIFGTQYNASQQISASIGNLKYGGGSPSSGYNNSTGGNAGPNGNGGNGGFYTSGGYSGFLFGAGGGANGGSSVTSTTQGYGRGGSGNPQGWGGYYNSSDYKLSSTQDVLGTTNFVNNSASIINYGPYGGEAGYAYCQGCNTVIAVNGSSGFIVITTPDAGGGGNFLQFF